MCQSFVALIKDYFVFIFWATKPCFVCIDRSENALLRKVILLIPFWQQRPELFGAYSWSALLPQLMPSKGQAGLIGQQGTPLYEKGPQKAQE